MKIKFIIVIMVFLILTGCGQINESSSDFIEKQVSYLEEFNLTVLMYDAVPAFSYELTKEGLLDEMVWGQIWMQLEVFKNVDANDYIGKIIEGYEFVVEGHPYEEKHNSEKSNVWLLTSGKQIIGGYALPIIDGDVLTGGVYPLGGDLEKFEEVAGMTYLEFEEYWITKYSN